MINRGMNCMGYFISRAAVYCGGEKGKRTRPYILRRVIPYHLRSTSPCFNMEKCPSYRNFLRSIQVHLTDSFVLDIARGSVGNFVLVRHIAILIYTSAPLWEGVEGLLLRYVNSGLGTAIRSYGSKHPKIHNASDYY